MEEQQLSSSEETPPPLSPTHPPPQPFIKINSSTDYASSISPYSSPDRTNKEIEENSPKRNSFDDALSTPLSSPVVRTTTNHNNESYATPSPITKSRKKGNGVHDSILSMTSAQIEEQVYQNLEKPKPPTTPKLQQRESTVSFASSENERRVLHGPSPSKNNTTFKQKNYAKEREAEGEKSESSRFAFSKWVGKSIMYMTQPLSSLHENGKEDSKEEESEEIKKRSGKTLWRVLADRKLSIVINDKDDDDDDDDDEEIIEDDDEEEEKKMEENETTPLMGRRRKRRNQSDNMCSCSFCAPCSSSQHQKKKKKKKPKKKKKTLEFTSLECTIAILLYMLTSVLGYTVFFSHWPIIDSLYFAVVTFTTIGYGDLVPTNTSGKIFACIFGWAGVATLGVALGILGSNLVEAELHLIQMSQEASRRRIIGIFEEDHGDDDDNKKEDEETALQQQEKKDTKKEAMKRKRVHTEDDMHWLHQSAMAGWHHQDEGEEDCKDSSTMQKQQTPPLKQQSTISTCSTATTTSILTKVTTSTYNFLSSAILLKFLSILLFLLLGSIYVSHLEDWPLVDIFYYSIVTSCTIGYGDISPTKPHTRAFAVVFIPLAVAMMGDLLSTVASYIIELRQKEFREELRTKELTPHDLHNMHIDSSSTSDEVTKLDYVEFMLTSMKLVSKDVLEEIHDQFDRLDVTGDGTICKEDLKLMARNKMKSARKKLELAEYKKLLLEKECRQKERVGAVRNVNKAMAVGGVRVKK